MGYRKTKNLVGVNLIPNNDWVRRFKKVLSVQSKSRKEEQMIKFVCSELDCIDNLTYEVKENNIYVTKNTDVKKDFIYPCMVSHTDTVHDIIDSYHILRYENTFFAWDGEKNKQWGTGGDDKCGIFVTLELLKIVPNMKACFFHSEEIGCIGSGEADLKFFNDCGFILQVDRRGNDDFCTTYGGDKMISKEFSTTIENVIKKYGYSETIGGSTDVFKLKNRGLELSVCNMSSGYYDPHMSTETINIEDVWVVFQMCADLFHVLREKKWSHKVEKTKTSYNRFHGVHHHGSEEEEEYHGFRNGLGVGSIIDEDEEEETTHSVSDNEKCPCCKKTDMIHLPVQYFCYECFKLFNKKDKKEVQI
jgi:hypothetical protein